MYRGIQFLLKTYYFHCFQRLYLHILSSYFYSNNQCFDLQADIGAQVLIEDEDNILCEVMRLEIIQESQIDYDIEMKLSQQQFSSQLQHGARRSAGKPEALTRVRFDSDVNDPNTSYFVEDYYAPENEEFSSEQGYGAMYGETEGERRIRDLMVDRGLFGSLTDEEVDTLVIDINQSANTGRDKQVHGLIYIFGLLLKSVTVITEMLTKT